MSAFCVAMHAICIALSPERRRLSLFLQITLLAQKCIFLTPSRTLQAPVSMGTGEQDRVRQLSVASVYAVTCQYQDHFLPMKEFDHASLRCQLPHASTFLYILPAAILRLLSVCISHKSSSLLRGKFTNNIPSNFFAAILYG